MEKLIITAAICGAEVTKAQNPAVPYTVEEMVREAKSAYEAGAAILHIHVREDDGTPHPGPRALPGGHGRHPQGAARRHHDPLHRRRHRHEPRGASAAH